MVLGFKPQFVQPILNGTKKHTIREDKNNRWKRGNSIQMATGVRTKKYNMFKIDVCKGIQTIEIKWTPHDPDSLQGRSVRVFIDGKDVTMKDDIIDALVVNDGFESRLEFFTWFSDNFEGKIIHWTDLKYEK
jgi:hypothetical protein